MISIDRELVSRLIANQFPEWSDLPVTPFENDGWDNRTFRLGRTMAVRLPSAVRYACQVEKEVLWVPRLRPHLTLPVPVPLARGEPAEGYPWPWSVKEWLEGDTVSYDTVSDLKRLAVDLAGFLRELQAIDSSGGPVAGTHNFYRGGPLAVYDEETRTALMNLDPLLDTGDLDEIWRKALQSEWQGPPVWVHGDVAPGNLLVAEGVLCGVIDFGTLGVGDPACDLAMAWSFFDDESRRLFLRSAEPDEETWSRGRGWALWKALIVYDRNAKDSSMAMEARRVIDVILRDYQQAG